MVADIKVAQVLLPLPLGEAFDYAVPEEMDLAAGDLVVVPLGPRQVQGVVGEVGRRAGVNRSLKSILGKVDAPPLTVGVLEFVAWAARYGADSPGKPLAMALRG
ncbi:MAG TPA: primosomal protein N', partial [Caulobacteraceae bacterium]